MQRLYICQIKYTANEVVYILYKGYILIDGSFEIDFYLITCLVFFYHLLSIPGAELHSI
jgi:hypothetical protein